MSDITAADLSSTMLAKLRERFPSPGSVGNDTGEQLSQRKVQLL